MQNTFESNINEILCLLFKETNLSLSNSEKATKFMIYFISDFKMTNFNNDLKAQISKVNNYLTFLNSKFIIFEEMTLTELSLLIFYIIVEYNFIEEYINYIQSINNKHISASIKNLFKMYDIKEQNTVVCDYNEDILTSFNKLNFITKNIKKQMDLMINLFHKLNEIKKVQTTIVK